MAIFMEADWDITGCWLVIQHYAVSVHGREHILMSYWPFFIPPYSPLFMLITFGIFSRIPLWLSASSFGVAYLLGVLALLWVGTQFASGVAERKLMLYAAPVIVFFPGLLVRDDIVSGNIAYILYGAILFAAMIGWKRENWSWFYLVVLGASCVKVQTLTLLAIPLLCSRNRQWLKASSTAVVALALYGVQARIWPEAFRFYLSTLKVHAQERQDFGCGPVGTLARILQQNGMVYSTPCILFYLVYGAALFLLLLWFAKQYRAQKISFSSWMPVMLMGVVLLNPRIQPYDVAWLSLPMALLAWRAVQSPDGNRIALWIGAAVLLGMNVFVEVNEDFVSILPDSWKYLEMILLLGIFGISALKLWREAGNRTVEKSGSRRILQPIGLAAGAAIGVVVSVTVCVVFLAPHNFAATIASASNSGSDGLQSKSNEADAAQDERAMEESLAHDFLIGQSFANYSFQYTYPNTYEETTPSLAAVDFKNRAYGLGDDSGGDRVAVRNGTYNDGKDQLQVGVDGVWKVAGTRGGPQSAIVSLWDRGCGASCTTEGIVFVYIVKNGKLMIVQRIGFDKDVAGTGAWFDSNSGHLRIRGRASEDSAQCCPKNMDVADFQWNGRSFDLKKVVRIPKEKLASESR
jgi:hypothetical protein